MQQKIAELLKKFTEVEKELAAPDVFNDQKRYRTLTQEHSYLREIKDVVELIDEAEAALKENKSLLQAEQDEQMLLLVKEEIASLEKQLEENRIKLETLLVPPDPDDDRNVIMEIRAGTGGDEAALFVGDCVRMYHLYAERQGWSYETLSCSPSEVGGYKEYTMVISGSKVKRFLEHEAGTHRVQRVPQTESAGRVHTSAVTVAVLLEPSEQEQIDLDEKDLRIDTYRASGAGGQHVNTTDSAVRITHVPTGIVAYCQDERSQHKNKDKALRHLKAKISDVRRQEIEEKEASTRASQIGTGDRSGRIRTYNFPQNRVTDHRINLTLYNLDYVMQGDLDAIVAPLVNYFYQLKLESA